MKKIYTSFFLLLGCALFAQRSDTYRFPCAGISPPADLSTDWNPSLTVTEADGVDEEASQQIKDSLAALYRDGSQSVSTQRSAAPPAAPVMGANFAGNGFGNSTPCDNEVAIANNGHLISVQNSNIYRYRTATSSSAGTQSLASWAIPLANSNTKYDPKVIYDPEANRFILVCLAGYSSNATSILIGFSRSDTANGTYNLYSIPGNPFNDTLWSDYPMIAVNHNELFCTINLLHDNMSWQLGFVQTLIWQINKWDGYAGDSLRVELHSGINYNGRAVRNLCPVEGGSNTYPGPDMYFLSDRNLDASNDTIFLVHVSDTANSPNQQVTVTPLVSNRSYFMAANATQPNYGTYGHLATNDSRILGAFIENNTIQFVSNTMDTANGHCAVYHGMIQSPGSSPSLTANIISDPSLDYGYPNIAYAGYGAGDNTALIHFLHTDTLTNPGNSAIASDGTGGYSSRTQLKAGLSYIDVLNGDERWGDYSGIQRKYDVGGTCWVNGMYATSNHAHATWIAEIGRGADVQVSSPENVSAAATVYPNPSADQFSLRFRSERVQQVRFVLYDMNGRMVKLLLEDQLTEGEARFSFSLAPLPQGVYLLRAETKDGAVLFNERIVRQ